MFERFSFGKAFEREPRGKLDNQVPTEKGIKGVWVLIVIPVLK